MNTEARRIIAGEAASEIDFHPMVEVARKLAPTFRARREAAEGERRIPVETISDLKASGLLTALQPRRFAGAEVDYPIFCRIVEELARGCSSTAWVYAVYTEHSWILSCFGEQAQMDVWGDDPSTLCCSVLAPRTNAEVTDGGFQLTGSWPFSSGCDHASWALLGANVVGESGRPERYLFLVPMSELTIVDDWHVLGLRATGSKTLKGEKLFVPAHRALRFDLLLSGDTPGSKVHSDYYLLRAPRELFAVYTLSGITLALAERARDMVVKNLAGKVSRGIRISEQEMTQIRIAESAADIDLARMRIRAGCAHHFAVYKAGGVVSAEQQLANRRDVIHVVRMLKSAVDRLCAAAGAQWVYDSDELQSILRDVTTASAHRSANWESAMIPFGRLALGLK